MVKLLNQTLKEWLLWTSRANLWIQNSVFDCMKTHKLESWPRDLRDFDLHRRPQIRSFTKLHLRTCSLGHVKTRRMSSQNIVRKLTHTRGRLFTQYIDYKMICHCICNLFSCWVQLQCFFCFLKQMPVYGISIEMSIPQSVAKIRRTLRPSAIAVATWLYSREHGPRERVSLQRCRWNRVFWCWSLSMGTIIYCNKKHKFFFKVQHLCLSHLQSLNFRIIPKKQFQHTEKAAFWTLRAKRVAGYFFQPSCLTNLYQISSLVRCSDSTG